MSGLDNLIEKIEADSNKKIDGIIAAGEKQGKEDYETFLRKAETEKVHLDSKTNDEVKSLEQRIHSNANLRSRDMILAAKQEILEKVFAKVIEKANDLSKDDYMKFLKNNIKKLSFNGNEELIIPSKYDSFSGEILNEVNKLVREISGTQIKMSNSKRNIKNGFIIVKDNSEINNTFEAIMDFSKDELEKIVLKEFS